MAQSALATLAGRTDTAAATAPNATTVAQGNIITGQWLYDRLIGNNEQDLSLMGIVRQLVTQVDVQTFKGALKDFVAVAKAKGEAQEKTARNHQTVLRTAYGALRFARDELTAAGGNEKTGYQMMRIIGKKALAAKGIKWDGTKVLSNEETALKRNTREAQAALREVQQNNPQMLTESFGDWMARIQDLVEEQLDTNREKAHEEKVSKLADKVIELCGDNFFDVMEELLARRQSATGETTEEMTQPAPATQETAPA